MNFKNWPNFINAIATCFRPTTINSSQRAGSSAARILQDRNCSCLTISSLNQCPLIFRRLAKASQSFIVILIVDVEKNSYIVHFHLYDSLQVTPEDCPAADISVECHDLGKDRTVQENRVATKAFVQGNHYLRIGAAVPVDDLIECLRANEGLVRKDNQGGVRLRIKCGKSLAQRTSHALFVVLIDHNPEPIDHRDWKLLPDSLRRIAEDEDDFIHPSGANVFEGLTQHRALAQTKHLFCFTHAIRSARSQNDGAHSMIC